MRDSRPTDPTPNRRLKPKDWASLDGGMGGYQSLQGRLHVLSSPVQQALTTPLQCSSHVSVPNPVVVHDLSENESPVAPLVAAPIPAQIKSGRMKTQYDLWIGTDVPPGSRTFVWRLPIDSPTSNLNLTYQHNTNDSSDPSPLLLL